MNRLICFLTVVAATATTFTNAKAQSMPKMVTSVEGIAEFELENGMRLLLFPDQTKDTVTVNNTIFVGSRHEGYGEAGMAHLLEHMVFKGTPTFEDIPKALQEHGASRSFNGTTWLDRTNYYETMPYSDENLEFAIKLEADRMINSYIKAEDLESEMTVVRNEFERGENSPSRVLRQRITSAAFDWHNYGQSTIGNRADIERVPVESLRTFYKRFYQPDNAMLVISGNFHPPKAIEYVAKYFGSIPKPKRKLNDTYTEEPAQDGERLVTLRRVGDVAVVGVAYHIVAGPHPDFAATDVLATSLVQQPSGRLYKALVETKLAASVVGGVFATHDPNLLMYWAEVVQGVEPQTVADTMLEVLEGLADEPLTKEEVDRSRSRLLADWEKASTNSQDVAIQLSEWAAQGDWRLYFLYRDRLESAKAEDVNRIAKQFLIQNNRTMGMFLPTKEASRATIPATPDLAKMIGDYKGRAEVEAGEKFDVSTANIESRSIRSTLPSGVKVVAIPKKTRGNIVDLRLTLRFGDLDSLHGKSAEARLLGSMLSRGSENRTRQQLKDELNKYRAKMSITSSQGSLTCVIQCKRGTLQPVLELMGDALNNPVFPEDELGTLKQQVVSVYEQQLSDPVVKAQIYVLKRMRPYDSSDPRYVKSPQEMIELIKAVDVDGLKSMHSEMISGRSGELTIIGDFDPEEVTDQIGPMLSSLEGSKSYHRIPNPSVALSEGYEQIETPDKENAVYFAGSVLPIRDDHEDYPALRVANDIFGGGGLSGRLFERVRQKDGLSYTVLSMLQVSAHDERGELMIYAIANPNNIEKVRSAIREEIERIRKDGITEEELKKAITSILQSNRVLRTKDPRLAGLIEKNTDAGRTMEFVEAMEDKISKLTVGEVNAAIRKYLDPNQILIATAGDFAGAKKKAEQESAEETPAAK